MVENIGKVILEEFYKEFYHHVVEMTECNHHFSNGSTGLNNYHLEGNIWTHTMMVYQVAGYYDDKVLLLSALLHDIGKPLAYEYDEEKNRVYFKGHEGLSFYNSVNILKHYVEKDIITRNEMFKILFIVANHGDLWSETRNDNDYTKKFPKLYERYRGICDTRKNFIDFIYCDARGRITTAKSNSMLKDFSAYIFNDKYLKIDTKDIRTKTLNIMVGPPGVGKSTFVKYNFPGCDIISRDYYVESKGIGENYNEKWKSLDDESHKAIDNYIMEDFRMAMKNGSDIVIDLTNMSRKSRRKWVNQIKKDYEVNAFVFVEDSSVIDARNHSRINKTIHSRVIHQMMKGLTLPLYDEVDTMYFVHDNNIINLEEL